MAAEREQHWRDEGRNPFALNLQSYLVRYVKARFGDNRDILWRNSTPFFSFSCLEKAL